VPVDGFDRISMPSSFARALETISKLVTARHRLDAATSRQVTTEMLNIVFIAERVT
jgi:hypothetical protein